MKNQIYLLVVFTSLLFLPSCDKEKDEGVLINFINVSETKISQARSNEIILGTIQRGGQTGYRKFDHLSVSSNTPLMGFDGYIDRQYIELLPLRCGVGLESLPYGKYDVVIDTVSYGTTIYFTSRLK